MYVRSAEQPALNPNAQRHGSKPNRWWKDIKDFIINLK